MYGRSDDVDDERGSTRAMDVAEQRRGSGDRGGIGRVWHLECQIDDFRNTTMFFMILYKNKYPSLREDSKGRITLRNGGPPRIRSPNRLAKEEEASGILYDALGGSG